MDGELTVGMLPADVLARQNVSASLETLVTEIELYSYLSKSACINDFADRIKELLRKVGFDAWTHTNVNIFIDVLDVFGTSPIALIKQYAKEEFYRDDLISRHMMVSEKPVFEHRVYDFLKSAPLESGLLARNLEIHKLMHQYGMGRAFSIPIVEQGYRSVFTISAKNGDAATFESAILSNLNSLLMLAKIMDNVGRRKFAPFFHGEKIKTPIPINLKPLQLLTALATKDLTLNEAAEVLGISISTANQQIAAAKKAFNTNTTHGAIVAAIQSGYIILDT